jgi:tartrate/fumarate subfamily iron-sulfur-dependent hydro-lyase beta chain
MTKEDAYSLHAGDIVSITGRIVTGRDRMHKFLFNERPSKKQIPFNLEGAIIYHCGPIIKKTRKGFLFVAGGPTTSMRVEIYEHRIISEYGIRGVMGKGGMGKETLDALKANGCVYLNTIGGAGVYLAEKVKRVGGVWKLEEFGMAEAMWLLEVKDFPAIVTMDAHGRSLHEAIDRGSYEKFKKLVRAE